MLCFKDRKLMSLICVHFTELYRFGRFKRTINCEVKKFGKLVVLFSRLANLFLLTKFPILFFWEY